MIPSFWINQTISRSQIPLCFVNVLDLTKVDFNKWEYSRVRTGLYLVKPTETVVNLTKLSPVRTAGKLDKLLSVERRLSVYPSTAESFTGPTEQRKTNIVSFTSMKSPVRTAIVK